MLDNPFIRAIGLAAVAYLIFRGLSWALFAFASIAQSFAYWTKWHFVPWSEEVAIGLGIAFLIFTCDHQSSSLGAQGVSDGQSCNCPSREYRHKVFFYTAIQPERLC